MEKMNIAVMFGGRSVEHDVSIVSAIQAMENMDNEKYNIFPVFITKQNEFYYGEILRNIQSFYSKDELINQCHRVVFTKNNGIVEMIYFPIQEGKERIASIDVFFPIVHGTNVEDGILQGFLKTLDAPFVGCDVLSSAIGMDKYMMKIALESEGFPVLPAKRFSINDYDSVTDIVKSIEKCFTYPVIVKPVNLGSSVGISVARNQEDLYFSVKNAFKFSQRILIERAILNLKEVNCSVLGDTKECMVSECEEPITSHEILDFEEKYVSGAKKCGSKGMASLKRKIPADISEEMRNNISDISMKVFKFLECCGVVRIDYMIDLDTNKLWLNEINTIPGSLAFYLWESKGVTYSKLIDQLIDLAIKRFENEKQVEYSFESSIIEKLSAK